MTWKGTASHEPLSLQILVGNAGPCCGGVYGGVRFGEAVCGEMVMTGMWKDDRYLYVPEFGHPKLEYETRDQSYFIKATMELTGRVHAYELSKVIEALEAEGYEVRKKEPPSP